MGRRQAGTGWRASLYTPRPSFGHEEPSPAVPSWGIVSMTEAVKGRLGRRPEKPAVARCEEILDAATELFAEHGYSDAVTQELAERLGVGKGTLYRYFPSKQELFLAAVDRVMRRLREHVDAAIRDIGDPLDVFARAVEEFLAFFEEHPKYAEMLIQERALFKDRTKPTYVEHREVNVERWRAVWRGLIADGVARDVPVERITNVVGDLIYGTVFTNYFAGQKKPSAEQARDILDIVLHGVLTPAERARRGMT